MPPHVVTHIRCCDLYIHIHIYILYIYICIVLYSHSCCLALHFKYFQHPFVLEILFCWSLTLMRSVAVLTWRRFNYATFHLFVMMSRNMVVKADVAGPSVGVIGQAEGYCSRIRINAARATADGYSGWPAHSKPTQNVSAWLCVQSAWLCVQSACKVRPKCVVVRACTCREKTFVC